MKVKEKIKTETETEAEWPMAEAQYDSASVDMTRLPSPGEPVHHINTAKSIHCGDICVPWNILGTFRSSQSDTSSGTENGQNQGQGECIGVTGDGGLGDSVKK